MCGIAGKITITGQVNAANLKRMADAIAHRGPDDSGCEIVDGARVGLVNRRLAIVDRSFAGHQPMQRKDAWITFNGEIFNYQEIRQLLRKKGHRFNSNTDTEVILAGYEEWGINVIDRMRGQFAFALFDGRRRRLFLVRDRMGEKPLKYFWDGKTMVFASELKAILTQPEVVKEVNWKGVHQYLTYGYVPAPMTSFVGIKKLEPAHLVELNMVSGKLTKTRYWDVDFSKKLKLSENEWGERLRAGFEEATKLQMVADVPVGAFLSGGVDSSALVAMMAKSTKERVITFSIGFKDATHDETKYAKQIGKLFNTDHEVIRVNPWQVKSLLEMVEHFEELLANSSLLISYLVSKQARKKVTVVLTGDGGDENFSGYLKHQKLARDLWFDYYKQPTT